MTLDWVQIYFLFMMFSSIGIVIAKHNEKKPESMCKYNFWHSVGTTILCLPYYGRILGWW